MADYANTNAPTPAQYRVSLAKQDWSPQGLAAQKGLTTRLAHTPADQMNAYGPPIVRPLANDE